MVGRKGGQSPLGPFRKIGSGSQESQKNVTQTLILRIMNGKSVADNEIATDLSKGRCCDGRDGT